MENLIKNQFELFEQLKKASRNLKKTNYETRVKASYLNARIEAANKLEELFNKNHLEIVSKATSEQTTQLSYFQDDLQDAFQEYFIDYSASLKEFLSKANPTSGKQLDESGCSSSHGKIPWNNSEVQLPKIQLPVFNGKYTEWPSFYDMFLSLIHNNTLLSPVQKLHYLKSSLSGEPEILLRNFSITTDNYKDAWEQLIKRYNNKRYNCNAILKMLFSQKNIQHESATALKQLLDTTSSCLKALNNLGIKTDGWNAVVIYLVASKLDLESHRQWENFVSGVMDDLPTWSQMEQFLETKFRSLEMTDTSKQTIKNNFSNKNTNQCNIKPKSFHSTFIEPKAHEPSCAICSGSHYIYYCSLFKNKPVLARQNFVQSKKLCFNCLAPTHSVINCNQNTSCRKCGRKHHTLLHFERDDKEAFNKSKQNGISKINKIENTSSDETTVVTNFSRGEVNMYNVLLATAVVKSYSKNGSTYFLRALLDQGSQASFITEESVQLLGLKRIHVNGKVSGIGNGHLRVSYLVEIEVQSRIEPEKIIRINAYVLKTLTSLLPTRDLHTPDWLELKHLPLADPGYASPGKVDVLLGADVHSEILLNGIKKSPSSNLVAQNTVFGWILSGRVTNKTGNENIKSLHIHFLEDEQLRKFWEQEDEPNKLEKPMTREEILCEKLYEATTTRREDGRFVVRLPFTSEDPQCQYGQSFEIAKRKLNSLEKRLCKNTTLYYDYQKVLDEYVTLNHMSLIDTSERNYSRAVYLPHHAVVREDKETTKVRVVFNASSKGVNNVSLNDDLLIGPKLQQDLRHLLLRWRMHPICIVADIVKMYRQVYVHEDDTNFQRILWRDNTFSPIQHFKLLTLTFGTACAPYLAVKTLQKLAELESDNFPLAAELTKKDYYVDDLMTGCETDREALEIYTQMNKLMKSGGFDLQKWSSNSVTFLSQIEKDKLNDDQSVQIKLDNTVKVLGIVWNRSTDKFEYKVNLIETDEPITKRRVLSDVSRLYDPIGWIAPVVIVAKVFIQKLWRARLNWDDVLPVDLRTEWLKYRGELIQIKDILIPRWINTRKTSKQELHAFSDASNTAYAAVVYIRVVDENERVHVRLITAKTKVAPIEKELSIPRLELCGATLAAKLLSEVSQVMSIPKEDLYGWTDSTIVLAWLQGPANRWATYVSNRVSHILTIMDYNQWGHVSTNMNPADSASRGLKPIDLKNCDLWWNGPTWLSELTLKEGIHEVEETHEEERVKTFTVIEKDCNEYEWMRFSDLTRLLKVLSFCRRFLKIKVPVKDRKEYSKFVSVEEMNETLEICIKQVQELEFGEEISQLRAKGCIAKKSALYTLYPFIDSKGILRVGGRLTQAEVCFDQKHPIIMPSKNHFTKLIVVDAHKKTLHGGPQIMMSFLRSKYWILRARDLVKKHYRDCVTCVRYSKAGASQLMGQLPEARVKPCRPFKTSGVDFAGPINIKFSPGRGAKSYKGYICLFVCMVTRAIHLEAVSDLSAKGFIAAFRRFVSRRGYCQDLYSDNGTNFVRGNAMLQDMMESAKSESSNEIAELLTLESTKWHFIPPGAPNFGGIWEAGVRCAKAHLKRVIGDITLTFEEMSTVLSQIEACLNSRPLSVLSDNPDDPLPLTPGHFLIGETLINVADRDHSQDNLTNLERWKIVQKIVDSFWKRWSVEYLNNLNKITKSGGNKIINLNIGDIVIVRDANIPPAKWMLGRIIEKHVGPDNVTRVVTLRCNGKILKRAVNKLCILNVAK